MLKTESKDTKKPYDMAYNGHTSTLKALLEQDDQLYKRPDENDRLLLHWAALGGHEDIVTHLISLGSPIDHEDDMKFTPLILAATSGRDKIVKILLNEGANVEARNFGGHSALQYAASKNWKAVLVLLLAKGADVNVADKRGATPLHRAASKGNAEIVRLLLEEDKIVIDKQDAYGNTPLHLACEEERLDEAALLIKAGASLTVKNKEEKTPLDFCKTRAVAQRLQAIADERDEEKESSNK
ncbi:26S proteasome non-ATPase regulatory subunit 10-like [Trichogramma pretiosum]|uniref:26S proteasome non-ATPase regulatory subunit 10-like n=1 Tax=Trichogramma pretiosum TaxID=7493 RepID=UPI0006C9AF6B|nr:26S proteasome non-ATPase regulatory subunit 10-like [Trichogramma pretiosum]